MRLPKISPESRQRRRETFWELPFLFKVLCAAQPLSIQVHPSKHAAEEGFAREESAGIAINAANRNYKDPNHKPELVYALTPFKAMNGFREFAEIAQLLQPVASAHPDIAKFIQSPDAQHLSVLFGNLLSMTGEQKSHALSVLAEALNHQQGPAWMPYAALRAFIQTIADSSHRCCSIPLSLSQAKVCSCMQKRRTRIWMASA